MSAQQYHDEVMAELEIKESLESEFFAQEVEKVRQYEFTEFVQSHEADARQ